MKEEHQLLWALLPDGLEEYFEVEGYEKTEMYFRITLIEKNKLPVLPKQHQGKQVVNTILKAITVDYFPVRGTKGELVLKRRCWKLEGVKEWIKRDINICAPGTKLEKEFADFLKELGGDTTCIHK